LIEKQDGLVMVKPSVNNCFHRALILVSCILLFLTELFIG